MQSEQAIAPAADVALARRIVDFLNELIRIDRPAVAALLANRVPCNKDLSDHPTLQVSAQHGGYHVGMLGVLNGLCGFDMDGGGLIVPDFCDGNLACFVLSDRAPENVIVPKEPEKW